MKPTDEIKRLKAQSKLQIAALEKENLRQQKKIFKLEGEIVTLTNQLKVLSTNKPLTHVHLILPAGRAAGLVPCESPQADNQPPAKDELTGNA
jgi:hypothetical protein